MSEQLEAWEGEGGASLAPPLPDAVHLTGTASQVEWAQRIKCRVNREFDRVAASFREVAAKQQGAKRADTEAILAILEDKRAEALSKQQAGYFIREWQEIDDQVRQLIARDPRYLAIKSKASSN